MRFMASYCEKGEEMRSKKEIIIVKSREEMKHWDAIGMFNYVNSGKRNEDDIFISDNEIELKPEE